MARRIYNIIMSLKGLLKKKDMARYNKRLAELHQEVFGSKAGKELLLDYMTRFNVLNTPEVQSDREQFMNDGARKVIQHMLAYTCCDPADFLGKIQDNFED